ncbi:MAG TPA: gliding motility protein GldC [Saprospiraceae bacterium]|nr:gliding motility protein GldC [Saprospiraceae bacterium]
MEEKIVRYSDIIIKVGLDENNTPIEINWMAQDNPSGMVPQACKAFLLSIFDETNKDTLKIDLWTNEMQVIEMDRFFYQTFRGMVDTYLKSTNNKELSDQMHQFVQYVGEKTEIIPKLNSEV